MLDSNKKGQGIFGLIITFIVLIFVSAILGLALFPVFNDVNNDIQADTSMHNESKTLSQDKYDEYGNMTDNITITIVIFMWLGILLSSYYFQEHPLFLFFAIFFLVALTIVAAVLSNTYTDFSDQAEYSVYKTDLPITVFVLDYYPFLIVGMIISALLIMVMKKT